MNHPPNRIKEQMIQSRLSLTEVARLMDLSPAAVSRHINRERGISPETADKYAAIFKITSACLFVELKVDDLDA